MFDFPFKEASIVTSVYCLVYYLILVFANYQDGLRDPFINEISERKEKLALFFVCFFIITHCYNGDFFHLMHRVYEYSSIPEAYNFGEEIYHKIGLAVGKNYFFFRSIIWGGAFSLFCLTAKRMNVSVYFSAILLIATHPIIFSYARATAAMAVYFYGFSFLCVPFRNKLVSYIIGVLIIYFSTYFHRSATIMLIMTAMIYIPIRKWSIILIVIAFFGFSNVFKEMLMNIAMSENTDIEVSNKIVAYSQRSFKHGLSGIINSTLEYASFYIPFIIVTINILNNDKFYRIPNYIFRMYKVAAGFVLISLLFFFLGPSYVTFVYRVLFMSMIPITIVIVYLYQSDLLSNTHHKWCVFSGIIYSIVLYLYSIYLTYLSSINI